MELFLDIIKDSKVRIDLLVHGRGSCSVVFAVTDGDDRRNLKRAMMHHREMKIHASSGRSYKSAEEEIDPLGANSVPDREKIRDVDMLYSIAISESEV